MQGITRPNLTGLPTVMVRSYWELGDILHFDPDTARRNICLLYTSEPGVPTVEEYCANALNEGEALGLCGLTASKMCIRDSVNAAQRQRFRAAQFFQFRQMGKQLLAGKHGF